MTPSDLYAAAREAGLEAVRNLKVVPMVVGTPKSLWSNEFDTSQPTYYVEDGVCGFAWVNVKPGNSKLANWLKANGLARSDSYYGGVTVWIGEFNQSMQKKEAYARAFAKVLSDNGVRAYSDSRMD